MPTLAELLSGMADRDDQVSPSGADLGSYGLAQILAGVPGLLGAAPGRSVAGTAIDKYWNLRGQPESVINSILYAPSYGESDTPPFPAGAAKDALNFETAVSPPGWNGRTEPLTDALDLRNYLRSTGETYAEGEHPNILSRHPRYPGPLPPGMRKYPLY